MNGTRCQGYASAARAGVTSGEERWRMASVSAIYAATETGARRGVRYCCGIWRGAAQAGERWKGNARVGNLHCKYVIRPRVMLCQQVMSSRVYTAVFASRCRCRVMPSRLTYQMSPNQCSRNSVAGARNSAYVKKRSNSWQNARTAR